jgi:hypothetical protein
MIQPTNLFRQRTTDGQALEFGSETGTVNMFGIVLKRPRSGGFDMFDPLAAIGDVFFERI